MFAVVGTVSSSQEGARGLLEDLQHPLHRLSGKTSLQEYWGLLAYWLLILGSVVFKLIRCLKIEFCLSAKRLSGQFIDKHWLLQIFKLKHCFARTFPF
jgi:hypothetical protein